MTEHVFETVERDGSLGVVVDGSMVITGVTAQREEIVRCRDCVNYCPAEDDDHEDGCALAYAYLFKTSPDGFCAWGERRGA